MEGLTGYRFGSGFTIMNGVPNSTINRYHQVNNALIENNTLVNVDHVHFAAGSDAERSAAPINSKFQNNLIFSDKNTDGISIFDDISGVKFSGNLLSEGIKPSINDGFKVTSLNMHRAKNGLLYPEGNMHNVGAAKTLTPIQKDQVGASYYPKTEPDVAFDSGNTIEVKPTENALFNAINNASSGDVLILENGNYNIGKVIKLDKTITIKAKNRKHVTLYPQRSTFVDINNFGSLKLVNLIISGKRTPDAAGNTLIRTSRTPMQHNYRLEIEGSIIEDLNVNHSFHLFDAGHRSFADHIKIANTTMSHISGDIIRLNKETDDLGIYNAEYIYFTNNLLENVEGAVAKVYRGGTDESTFGPHFIMQGNVLKNVGTGKRNKQDASVYLHGVQVAQISENKWFDSAPIDIEHTVGEPVTAVTNNEMTNTMAPKVIELRVKGPHTATLENNTVK
tara:strand:- start:139 stop:1488 length:1350 start_codon:yes stop_codon:yes gene_type:complete